MRASWVLVLCLAAAAAATRFAAADERDPVRRAPAPGTVAAPDRVIVKFRQGAASPAGAAKPTTDPVAELAARERVKVMRSRPLGPRMHVLEIDPASAGESMATQLERLRSDSGVEYAEPDARRYPLALPNDPLYPGQWYLQSPSVAPSAIDAESAWNLSTGSDGVVVADVDTGVLFDHPDLGRAGSGGRLLPGYDFVADPSEANDGDGRDSDASDPGDWVSAADVRTAQFKDCTVSDSSWHGTRVAGILGAQTDNSTGIAGTTWRPWILPIRALGKCGGLDSDILPAILWAAGIPVPGVPDNPYPAKIVNLSIGATGDCPAAYRDVIDQLTARGVLVVASAGNEGGPVDAPANCPGVVGVAGLRQVGTKVGYSSLGPEIALSAPAGNCVNTTGGACLYPIDTTDDVGTTTHSGYAYTDQTDINVGTSFSAPIVSGVAALMVSANGNLGTAALIARLEEGAKAFPASSDPSVPQCHVPTGPNDLQVSECSCTTPTCGAGMANAPGALEAALRPIAAVAVPAAVSAGQDVELSAAGSAAACGRLIAAYAWSVVDGGASGTGVSSTDTATTSVTAPTQGTVTVRVTVTDDAGRTDTADVIVGPASATTTAPADAGTEACPTTVVPPAPPPVTVTVTPSAAAVQAEATQAFSAVVRNASDTAVTWEVDGVPGGNSTVGTISAIGVYTAPAAVPSPSTVTVSAVASADASVTGAAFVTVEAKPVSPSSAGGSGGGGGGGGVGPLGLLAALWALGRRRRGVLNGSRP